MIAVVIIATASVVCAERLPIKVYNAADGLPCDHINRIVQDSRGFLWFCTTEGLSRFDGYRFNNYGTEQGLADRQVNDLLETRDGSYWVGTTKGLSRLNNSPRSPDASEGQIPSTKFTSYYPGDEAYARYITTIYEDHSGSVLCGTKAANARTA